MTAPDALHAALLALLEAIPNVTAYDGNVPPSPPAADGSREVLPYVVLWGSAGTWPEAEAAALSQTSGPELDWPVQLTVAAGRQVWVLRAAAAVRAAVLGVELVPGASPLREPPGAVPVQFDDRNVTPGRFFLPLSFTTAAS